MQNLPSMQEIREFLTADLQAVNQQIKNEMTSEVPLAEIVMEYAVSSGGKRFRPMLTVLCAGLFNCQEENIHIAAAMVEFIHTATLLHDDVVDESDKRRGRASVNAAFSNAAAVLVGDYFYTRAFQMMVRIGNTEVLQTMANATNLIAAGEIMQLEHTHNPDINEERYWRVIELKTAVLFSAACRNGAVLAGANAQQIEKLTEYGKLLGMAFQIADDVLDYTGDAEKIGKSLGDDLAEGKPTLPLIRALSVLQNTDKERLYNIIKEGKREDIAEVLQLLAKTDALEYSRQKALEIAAKAADILQDFPETKAREYLAAIPFISVIRSS